MRGASHAGNAAERIEGTLGTQFRQVGADSEEVGHGAEVAEEVEKVRLRPLRGVGARHAKRQVNAESDRPARCLLAQPAQKCGNVPDRTRRREAPLPAAATRNRNPALARIHAPVRMCGDGRRELAGTVVTRATETGGACHARDCQSAG